MNQIYLYKNRVLNQLLNGYIEYYSNYTDEAANYMITTLNQVVSENIGLCFVEEEVFFKYKQVIDVVADKLTDENMNYCSSLIRKIMIIFNNEKLKEEYKKEFMISQCKKRNVCINEVNFFDFLKKAVYYDDNLIPFIIYKDSCYSSNNEEFLTRTYFIESSLNYFYATNIDDEKYYQSFIDRYYELFNVNLLSKANQKVVDFPVEKQTLLKKIFSRNK